MFCCRRFASLVLVACFPALLASSVWAQAGLVAVPTIEAVAFGVDAAPVRRHEPPFRNAENGAAASMSADPVLDARATRVARNDTWESVLDRLSFMRERPGPRPAWAWMEQLPRLIPAKYVRLRGNPDRFPVDLDYVLNWQESYAIRLDTAGAQIQRVPPDKELLEAVRNDASKASLFSASDAVGLPEAVALQLSEVFANEVDFLRDLEKGYRCAVVFEMYYPDGIPTPGNVLAAEFISRDKRITAYRFENGVASGGVEAHYFGPDGIDINRTLVPASDDAARTGRIVTGVDINRVFRRSPLAFSRITSAPSALRYHPILKEWRAHRGTDYGAPIGTKVMATADGVVDFAGQKGGYGNLVQLRHFDRFSTYYGHLHAFLPGLKRGAKVKKGEVIGFVGMTGLATGPHLHYEFRTDSNASAPATIPFMFLSIDPGRKADFQERIADYRRKLDFAQRMNLVMLD